MYNGFFAYLFLATMPIWMLGLLWLVALPGESL